MESAAKSEKKEKLHLVWRKPLKRDRECVAVKQSDKKDSGQVMKNWGRMPFLKTRNNWRGYKYQSLLFIYYSIF
jgi:hypothetical protein